MWCGSKSTLINGGFWELNHWVFFFAWWMSKVALMEVKIEKRRSRVVKRGRGNWD